jgi:hypothetical protein
MESVNWGDDGKCALCGAGKPKRVKSLIGGREGLDICKVKLRRGN